MLVHPEINFLFLRTKTESPPKSEEIKGGAKWGDSGKKSLWSCQARRDRDLVECFPQTEGAQKKAPWGIYIPHGAISAEALGSFRSSIDHA